MSKTIHPHMLKPLFFALALIFIVSISSTCKNQNCEQKAIDQFSGFWNLSKYYYPEDLEIISNMVYIGSDSSCIMLKRQRDTLPYKDECKCIYAHNNGETRLNIESDDSLFSGVWKLSILDYDSNSTPEKVATQILLSKDSLDIYLER